MTPAGLRLFVPALAALVALAGCGARALPEPPPSTHPIRIQAVEVPIDPDRPGETRIGDFLYAGGLVLKSDDTSLFGGLSDLKVAPNGDMIAETDQGELLRAHIVLDAAGRLRGLDQADLSALVGEDGQPLQNKTEADSEGVAPWPNGDLMVSFERDHRIWLYPAAGGPPQTLPRPPVAMPDNSGMEGLALAPSQGLDAYWVGIEGGSIWLCRLQVDCRQWAGLPSPPLGYRLTALGETPGGDFVVVHHGYNPLTESSRVLVSILALPKDPDGRPKLKAQLKLDPPFAVDNFEGVAAVTSPTGGLRLYLISDDNFSPRQRTLLFAFDLAPTRATAH